MQMRRDEKHCVESNEKNICKPKLNRHLLKYVWKSVKKAKKQRPGAKFGKDGGWRCAYCIIRVYVILCTSCPSSSNLNVTYGQWVDQKENIRILQHHTLYDLNNQRNNWLNIMEQPNCLIWDLFIYISLHNTVTNSLVYTVIRIWNQTLIFLLLLLKDTTFPLESVNPCV